MDLHVTEPNGPQMWYSSSGPTTTGGKLDRDDNVGVCGHDSEMESACRVDTMRRGRPGCRTPCRPAPPKPAALPARLPVTDGTASSRSAALLTWAARRAILNDPCLNPGRQRRGQGVTGHAEPGATYFVSVYAHQYRRRRVRAPERSPSPDSLPVQVLAGVAGGDPERIRQLKARTSSQNRAEASTPLPFLIEV